MNVLAAWQHANSVFMLLWMGEWVKALWFFIPVRLKLHKCTFYHFTLPCLKDILSLKGHRASDGWIPTIGGENLVRRISWMDQSVVGLGPKDQRRSGETSLAGRLLVSLDWSEVMSWTLTGDSSSHQKYSSQAVIGMVHNGVVRDHKETWRLKV